MEATDAKSNSWVAFMRYIILSKEKGRWIAEFRGSEKAKPSARIGVDKEVFEEFLKGLRFERVKSEGFKDEKKGTKSIYTTENDILFELSMIHAYIMRVIKKEGRKKLKNKITEALFKLHAYELLFWNHHFASSKDRFAQDRVARAFLTLYNLR